MRAIEAYLENHRQEMVEDICALIRIPSIRGEALPGMPFGQQTAAVLELALLRAKEDGFRVKNYENYVGTIDFNEEPAQLDILAHLDVVPAQAENWRVTAPFVPLVKDGRIYGRGSADDKGPAIAALYAMKALRASRVPLRKNVRLILGTDEESGSSDLQYYYAREREAPMSFSPDADFPLIHVEKGRFAPDFAAEWEEEAVLPRVLEVQAGTARNIVPDTAVATIAGLSAEQVEGDCRQRTAKTGVSFSAVTVPEGVRITAHGAAAHASTPEEGNNALTALWALLAGLPLASGKGRAYLQALAGLFPHGDFMGRQAGVAMQDAIGGALTLSPNLFSFTGTALFGSCDSRIPPCATKENLVEVFRARLEKENLRLTAADWIAAHVVPEDHPLVQTLLRCYEQYTGQKGYCRAIGGITYVHNLKNAVAFGCTFPGTNNHMHSADEFVVVEELITSAKIFAKVIVELCG